MIAEIGAKIALIENAMGTAANLPLAKIRTDGGTQARQGLDMATVGEYAVEMQNGAKFPALTIFYDGEAYWLADGFHRLAAAKVTGLTEIACDVRQGRRREAVLFACGANAKHGLPRTNDDKRRAVETLLRDEEWCKWSDRYIANQCRVSAPFVGKIRAEVAPTVNVYSNGDNGNGAGERVYTRNGKEQVMKTATIGNGTAAPNENDVSNLTKLAAQWLEGRAGRDLGKAVTLANSILSERTHAYCPKWEDFTRAMPAQTAPATMAQALSHARDRLQSRARKQETGGANAPVELRGVVQSPAEIRREMGQLVTASTFDTEMAMAGALAWLRSSRFVDQRHIISCLKLIVDEGDESDLWPEFCEAAGVDWLSDDTDGFELLEIARSFLEDLEAIDQAGFRRWMFGPTVAAANAATATSSSGWVYGDESATPLDAEDMDAFGIDGDEETAVAVGKPQVEEIKIEDLVLQGLQPKAWEKLVRKGATDDEILGHLSWIWGDGGGFSAPGQGWVWKKGGKKPFFCYADDFHKAMKGEGKKVTGGELIQMVRDLLGITYPKATEISDAELFQKLIGPNEQPSLGMWLDDQLVAVDEEANALGCDQPATHPTPYDLLLSMSDKQRGIIYNALKFSRSHYEPRTDGTDQSASAFFYAMFTEAMALFDIQN